MQWFCVILFTDKQTKTTKVSDNYISSSVR